jgi:flotillin
LIGPAIADALAQAKMVTISGGDSNAPETTTNNMVQVIQTVLAAQMVGRGGMLNNQEKDKDSK